MRDKLVFILFLTLTLVVPQAKAQTEPNRFSGTIYNEYNRPMSNASVVYKVKDKDAELIITDKEGAFQFEASSDKVVVVVSYPDYYSQTLFLSAGKSARIALEKENLASRRKEVRTPYGQFGLDAYHITAREVKGDREFVKAESIEEYWKGTAGAYTQARSGLPGEGSHTLLRGITGLHTMQDPLVVVDGVVLGQFHLEDVVVPGNDVSRLVGINPKDIQDIVVLRDNAATAIYGTKGANGVILISSYNPIATKTTVSFEANQGTKWFDNTLPMMNADQHRDFLRSQLLGSGMTAQNMSALYPFLESGVGMDDYPAYDQDSDWQDEVLQAGQTTDFFVNLRGGDQVAKFYASAGVSTVKGVMDATSMMRFTSRLNAAVNITDKFTFDGNFGLSLRDDQLVDMSTSMIANPLLSALSKSPMQGIWEAVGQNRYNKVYESEDALGMSNPMALITDTDGMKQELNFTGNLAFNYQFTQNLRLVVRGGVEYYTTDSRYFRPDFAVGTFAGDETENFAQKSDTRYFALNNENYLQFSTTEGKEFQLNGKVGTRFAHSANSLAMMYGINTGSDERRTVNYTTTDTRRKYGYDVNYRSFGGFGQLALAYKNKWFADVNVAVDGSSRVGPDASGKGVVAIGENNFGLFYGATVAYDLFKEDVFANSAKTFNQFKVFASASKTGNDGYGDFLAQDYYQTLTYWKLTGIARSAATNTQARWEDVYGLSAGVQAELFSNRLKVDASAFQNTTKNMLVKKQMDPIYGLDHSYGNEGEMESTGFELAANVELIRKKNWGLSIGGEVTNMTTEITQLNDIDVVTLESCQKINKQGLAPGAFWGYQTNGIYDSFEKVEKYPYENSLGQAFRQGDVCFVDQNGDGKITKKDKTVIGNPMPEWFGSAHATLRFKNLSLRARMNFVGDHDVYNSVRRQVEGMTGLANQSTAVLLRENLSNGIPQNELNDPMKNARFSDRWIENGAYWRLQDVTLAYDVNVAKVNFLNSLQVYASGKNLWTKTDYLGYDPEFFRGDNVYQNGIDNGRLPISSTLMVGVKVGF